MYLSIVPVSGAVFSIADVITAVDPTFPRVLNFEEAFRVLEEDCRPLGLQPELYLGSVRIVTASKKFLRRERRYNCPMSKRAQQYIKFTKKKED